MSYWPKHEDGTNKTVGEMTPEEKRAMFLSVAAQYEARGDAFAAGHFRRMANRAQPSPSTGERQMGREVRMVPPTWEHPKYDKHEVAEHPYRKGRFKPLQKGYESDAACFMEMATSKGLQEAIDYFGRAPDKNDYMPDWPAEECTHLMMYENTSEGTPISPAFATPEELARWLADNNASAFGSSTATYEQWLATAKRGWAVSAIMDAHGFRSGVEAMDDD